MAVTKLSFDQCFHVQSGAYSGILLKILNTLQAHFIIKYKKCFTSYVSHSRYLKHFTQIRIGHQTYHKLSIYVQKFKIATIIKLRY